MTEEIKGAVAQALKENQSGNNISVSELMERRVKQLQPLGEAQEEQKPAEEVQAKKIERQTAEGNEIQSFRTLLDALSTQCRNTCEFGDEGSAIEITRVTDPTPLQMEAFSLLENYCSQQP